MKAKSNQDKLFRYIFYFIFAAILFSVIFSQKLLPTENTYASGINTYNDNWVRVYSDGSSEAILLPNQFDVKKGEDLVIQSVLAGDICNKYLCLRSSHESVHVYIDDEEIVNYDTSDNRFLGNNTASRFIFVKLLDEYSNKTIKIVFSSNSIYSGTVKEIYLDDSINIFREIITKNILITLINLFVFFISLWIIIFSVFFRIILRKHSGLIYAGLMTLALSLWQLCESKLRQWIFPNASIAANAAFLFVLLVPFSSILLLDYLQGSRYKKFYRIIYIVLITYFIISIVLHLTNVADLLQTMFITYAVSILSGIIAFSTIFIDVKHKQIENYKNVIIGFLTLIVFSIAEVVIAITGNKIPTGLFFATSVLLFDCCCIYQFIILYKEKQFAEKQIRVSMEMKDQFLANMSHELRTPINSVLGMNEMVLRETNDPSIIEYSKDIQSSANMLLGLVNDILDFSKIESGKFKLVVDRYNTVDLFNELYQLIIERAKSKNLDVIFNIDKDMPTVLLGDSMRIKQIIVNLLTNAVKYTEKGSITLIAKSIYDLSEGYSISVAVADTGQGIKEENLSKMFDSFTRLEMQQNKTIEGTGLGLSITKSLVSQMNGYMDVKSKFGEGSVFTVIIPQTIKVTKQIRNLGDKVFIWEIQAKNTNFGSQAFSKKPAVNKPAKTEYKPTLVAPDKRLLVVDDNSMNLKVVNNLLKNTQLNIDMASSGNQAIEFVKNNNYDIILMDHMMPEMDGIEAMHIIKDYWKENGKPCPIIALTANAIVGMKEMYISEGFDGYLAKPFKAADLEALITEHIFGAATE